MTPDALKSYFVTLMIGPRNKIDEGKKEKLGIKFSISFLFFRISEVFRLESRIKLRENKLRICDANLSFLGLLLELFFSFGTPFISSS